MFDTEIRLLRDGYKRRQLQVFSGPGGAAVYQGLWLRPAVVADGGDAKPRSQPPSGSAAAGYPPDDPGDPGRAAPPGSPSPDQVGTGVADPPVAPRPDPESRRGTLIHVVGKGESLVQISRKYKVSADEITKENRLRGDWLREGQKLRIPVRAKQDG